MRTRKRVRLDRRTKVLEFRDDETTRYAILSHRWIERQGDRQRVSYEKMVELAKLEEEDPPARRLPEDP